MEKEKVFTIIAGLNHIIKVKNEYPKLYGIFFQNKQCEYNKRIDSILQKYKDAENSVIGSAIEEVKQTYNIEVCNIPPNVINGISNYIYDSLEEEENVEESEIICRGLYKIIKKIIYSYIKFFEPELVRDSNPLKVDYELTSGPDKFRSRQIRKFWLFVVALAITIVLYSINIKYEKPSVISLISLSLFTMIGFIISWKDHLVQYISGLEDNNMPVTLPFEDSALLYRLQTKILLLFGEKNPIEDMEFYTDME